jgi:hypothetical protein
VWPRKHFNLLNPHQPRIFRYFFGQPASANGARTKENQLLSRVRKLNFNFRNLLQALGERIIINLLFAVLFLKPKLSIFVECTRRLATSFSNLWSNGMMMKVKEQTKYCFPIIFCDKSWCFGYCYYLLVVILTRIEISKNEITRYILNFKSYPLTSIKKPQEKIQYSPAGPPKLHSLDLFKFN